MKIALDAMGGDLAPKATVEGAVLAARDFGIEVVMVGDREILGRELAEHQITNLPIRIEHASEAVLMDDSPLESVINKPQSSIHVGFDLLKNGQVDGFISAGNSGAVMATAMAILGNLAHIDRPAIASLVPSSQGTGLLIDAGANTDVKPINLVQFAVMGSVYWHHVRNVARPRVGILSNGEEESKGTDVTRAAAAMLKQMSALVNYVGYVEGHDINRGNADVIVTDGFTGNIALKTMEGFASFMSGNLRELFSDSWRARISFFMVRKRLSAMRQRLDPHEYGGAPLLGVNGVAIIAHGSSNAQAIRNAIRNAADEAVVRHVNSEIVEILSKSQPVTLTKPNTGKGFRGLLSRMRERLHRQPREGEAVKNKGTGPLPAAASLGNHPEAPRQEHLQFETRPGSPDGSEPAPPPPSAVNGGSMTLKENHAAPADSGDAPVETDAPTKNHP